MAGGTRDPLSDPKDQTIFMYLQSTKRLNSCQACLALFQGKINFSLSYRPGSHNDKPDALSHMHDSSPERKDPETILPSLGFVGVAVWDIEWVILQAEQQQPDPGSWPFDWFFILDPIRYESYQSNLQIGLPSWGASNSSVAQQCFGWPWMSQDGRYFVATCLFLLQREVLSP